MPKATECLSLSRQGCNLSYRITGDGEPVIFVQGVGVHGDGWAPQVTQLSTRYRCLTFDNRGMGMSQPVGAALTVPLMAQDALALMDAQGWESAHVVGHSMGGIIALEMALAARSRVRSLALLCTFSRGRDAAIPSPRMMWIGMRTRVGTRRMRRNAFLEIVMPPDVLATADRDAMAEELVPLFGHDLADSPPIAMKQLGATGRYDATPRLGELAGLRTLVMGASHDPISTPAITRALAAAIPGATLIEVPDAAHGVPIQHAARVNEVLARHFAG